MELKNLEKCPNYMEQYLDLLDQIKAFTLEKTALYLRNRSIKFNYLIDYLRNPRNYPGDAVVGPRKIIDKFLRDAISQNFRFIKQLELPIKFVYQLVMKDIFGGDFTC